MKITLDIIKGFIAAVVCVIIWNIQGYVLQYIFVTRKWNCTLLVSYSTSIFLSFNLLLAMVHSHQTNKSFKAIKDKIFNKRMIYYFLFASFMWYFGCATANFAYKASGATIPLVVAAFQMCSVFTVLIQWILFKKLPSLINGTGCVLLIEGVIAFNLITYNLQNPEQKMTYHALFNMAFIWALISALLFSGFQHVQEFVLKDIATHYVLGVIAVYTLLWGWIPPFIAHFAQFERISMPSGMVVGFIFINGISEVVAQYCALYAVRTTNAFMFTGGLSLGSPIAMCMESIQKKIQHKSQQWSSWYIPSFMHIVVGCIYVYWVEGKSKDDESNHGSSDNTKDNKKHSTSEGGGNDRKNGNSEHAMHIIVLENNDTKEIQLSQKHLKQRFRAQI